MNGKEWSADDNAALREHYPGRPTGEVASMLTRSVAAVYGQANKLGLVKSEDYRASPAAYRFRRGEHPGKETQFQPGHVPVNKGLRRPGYAPGRMKETQFVKGQRAANYLPIGTRRNDSDGYPRVKIADGLGGFGNSKVWEFVHRRVWEAAHGPIPKGHRLWWKDGDRNNCALENLELLSGAEHMKRTTIQNMPPALRDTYLLKGVLVRRIRKMEKSDGRKVGPRKTA